MTIRFNDAAVCDKQGTPKLAIYAFKICHYGVFELYVPNSPLNKSYVYQIAFRPRHPVLVVGIVHLTG